MSGHLLGTKLWAQTQSTMGKKLNTVLFLPELVEWLGRKTFDKNNLQICIYSSLRL